MLYEFDHQHLDDFQTATAAPAPVLTIDGPTDEELLARLQARDESALTALMVRHHALLHTVIHRIVHCEAETADVFQEVLIELWNRAGAYDPTKGKALGWMITMSRRRAIDRIRRRQAYDRAGERLRHEIETDPHDRFEPAADETAGHSDRMEILREVLSSLPDAQREAMELAYFRGLSQREIARTLNCPLGTIKTRLELGIRKVRTALLDLGGVSEWSAASAR